MTQRINKDELLEKIVADYTLRLRQGRAPSIGKYQDKYPAVRDEIEELLSSVAMIEGLKTDQKTENQFQESDISNLKQLGDYLLIREVGRGGMGLVFEAVHQSLGRRVAIKIMRQRNIQDEKYIARFRREARSAARLHHTNIVSVFGVGQAEGFHYYVMEFIDGFSLNRIVQSLTRKVNASTLGALIDTPAVVRTDANTRLEAEASDDDLPLNLAPQNKSSTVCLEDLEDYPATSGNRRYRWVAEVGSQISDALDHAHSQGILHRDIKPANLLLDKKDQVWITDFGLVKERNSEGLTQTGDVIGTPQYMAPESFKGQYDERSETYCLGLTLYELATLRPAFSEGTTAELIHRITTSAPKAPRKQDSQIPRDLGTIIEKAISKEPKQRYQTALELRDDLRAFLEDRPISARKPSTWEHVWRWGRRNPLPASLAAISALLLCAVAVSASLGYVMTTRAYSELATEVFEKETARKLAVENEQKAIANEKKIKIQFERAEANVALTIEAFDEMFKQIISPGSQSELDIDGFGELGGIETAVTADDAEFLKQMMKFYERFANQNVENQGLIEESARAYRRIANINYLIGETKDAIDAYKKSLEFYEPILIRQPNSAEALQQVVNTRAELSAAIRRSGDLGRADHEVDKNVKMIEAHPLRDLPEVQLSLARTLTAASSAVMNLAVAENASDLSDDERPGPDRFGPRRKDDRDRPERGRKKIFGFDVPDFRKFRGPPRENQKDYLKRVTQAISIGEKLIQQEPNNPEYRALLGKTYSSLAAVQLMEGGDTSEAQEALKKASERFQSLSDEFPNNLEYKYLLGITYLLDPSEAVDSSTKREVDRIVSIAKDLVQKSPNPEYKQLKILAHVKLASLHLESNNPDDAMKEQDEASREFRQLEDQVGKDREFLQVKMRIAKNYRVIGDTFRDMGLHREADRAQESANRFMRRRWGGLLGPDEHHPKPRDGEHRGPRRDRDRNGQNDRNRDRDQRRPPPRRDRE